MNETLAEKGFPWQEDNVTFFLIEDFKKLQVVNARHPNGSFLEKTAEKTHQISYADTIFT